MSKHSAWLQSQIPGWIHDGLIDEATAQALIQRYSASEKNSRGFSLLSAMGAVVFGLGIILFFAFNWSGFSKLLKLAVIFSSLGLFHGIALIIKMQLPNRPHLVEGFHLLGTMVFGAGIWLIAQIYHMDEHYPTAFLLWGLGALALAWAIPSVTQAVLACVLISVWGYAEVMDFNQVHVFSVVLIAVGILPLAWLQRSTFLLFIALTASVVLGIMNISTHLQGPVAFYALFSFAVILMAAAWAAKRSHFPDSASLFTGMGVLMYTGSLLILTNLKLSDATDKLTLHTMNDMTSPVLWSSWGMLSVAALAWLSVSIAATRSRTGTQTGFRESLQYALVAIALLMVCALAAGLLNMPEASFNQAFIPALVFNVILVLHCILLIMRGTDTLQWQLVASGSVTLAVLTFMRFNDLFHSLLARSLVFLAAGALLFLVGHLYAKRKLQVRENAEYIAEAAHA